MEVCVHWVDFPDDPDAPDPTDDDLDGVPNYAELALTTLENVWAQEIGALGYRAPLSDITSNDNGLNAKFDVYLDDLGSDFVYGYCTTDDPNRDSTEIFAVSAYCVLDNDYDTSQFGTAHTPQEFLEVTAAHEFHHASQFAYDWQEDLWLLEGTATNIEETVYPLVDDNVFFLDYFSPLTHPAVSLDRGGFGDSEYGAWIYWRYLQEKVAAGDLAILREIWERADSRDPDPNVLGDEPADDYSLLAVRKELAERGLVFADVFARFGVANRHPRLRGRGRGELPDDALHTDVGARPEPAGRGDAVLEDQPPRHAVLLVRPRRASLDDRDAPSLDHSPAKQRPRLAGRRAHGQLAHRAVPEAERDGAVEPAGGLRPWHDQARRPRPLERQHADVVLDELRAAPPTRASAARSTTAGSSPSAHSSPASSRPAAADAQHSTRARPRPT